MSDWEELCDFESLRNWKKQTELWQTHQVRMLCQCEQSERVCEFLPVVRKMPTKHKGLDFSNLKSLRLSWASVYRTLPPSSMGQFLKHNTVLRQCNYRLSTNNRFGAKNTNKVRRYEMILSIYLTFVSSHLRQKDCTVDLATGLRNKLSKCLWGVQTSPNCL